MTTSPSWINTNYPTDGGIIKKMDVPAFGDGNSSVIAVSSLAGNYQWWRLTDITGEPTWKMLSGLSSISGGSMPTDYQAAVTDGKLINSVLVSGKFPDANNQLKDALFLYSDTGKLKTYNLYCLGTYVSVSSFTDPKTNVATMLAVDAAGFLYRFTDNPDPKVFSKLAVKLFPTGQSPLSKVEITPLLVNGKTLVQAYCLGLDHNLYYTRQTDDGTAWSGLAPIIVNKNIVSIDLISQVADAFSTDDHLVFSVLNQSNNVLKAYREAKTQEFNYETVEVPDSNTFEKVYAYFSQITVKSTTSGEKYDGIVLIKSDLIADIDINGIIHSTGPGLPAIQALAVGGIISCTVYTTSLSAPVISATVISSVNAQALSGETFVDPMDSVRNTFHTLSSSQQILDAKSQLTGKQLLTGDYHDPKVAQAIFDSLQSLMNISYPALSHNPAEPSRIFYQGTMKPFMIAFDDKSIISHKHLSREAHTQLIEDKKKNLQWFWDDWDFGEIWEAVKEGIASVVDVIVDGINVTITAIVNGVKQAFNAVVNFAQQVFDVVEEVFKKVLVTFQEIFEWIGWFFETISAGVMNTKAVIQYYMGSIPTYLATLIEKEGKPAVDSLFQSLKNNFDSNFGAMREKVKSMVVDAENTFSKILNSIVSGALWLWNKIKAFASTLFSFFSKASKARRSPCGLGATDDFSVLVNEATAFGNSPTYKQAEASSDSYLQGSLGTEQSFLATTLDSILGGIQSAVDTLILTMDNLAQAALSAVADGLNDFATMINHEIEIPLLSWIYKQLTGDTLTVSINSLFSLAIAIPTFIVHEIVYQTQPFSDADVKEILGKPAFPMPGANLNAAVGSTSDTLKKAFNTVSAVATLVNIAGDIGLDVVEAPPPPPGENPPVNPYLWINTIASAVANGFRVPVSDFSNPWRWVPWGLNWVPQAISWLCIAKTKKGIRGQAWGRWFLLGFGVVSLAVNCVANYFLSKQSQTSIPSWIIGVVAPLYVGVAKPISLIKNPKAKVVIAVIDGVGGLTVAACLLANGWSSANDKKLIKYAHLESADGWNDFYFRGSTSDAYSTASRNSGALCSSPDILLGGNIPLSAQQISSYKTMSTNAPGDIYYKQPNYLYLRGHTNKEIAGPAQLHLYHVSSNLILNPSMWLYTQSTQTPTVDGATQLDLSTIPAGDTVFPTGFLWQNPDSPSSGNHYCMIAWMQTELHPDSPDDTYTANSWANFINQNPNFGWRNVNFVYGDTPDGSDILLTAIDLTGMADSTVLITVTGPVGWGMTFFFFFLLLIC